ncbi:MAG: DegT/DnrJ/EryC1/StrS family aminotransferase [Anaerolineae bacterium]|nr:DegT/DnrJ/EryC1/StrS family aminotransferase [Candidatus Roseilinea sp.]MDW8451346.1 DegT/DnrJ/EryC1/StrS family aminotransferase [Anaerolineae bacterium]
MIPISKPLIGEEERRAVLEVLDSGMLVQGPRVAQLEEAWAAACGTKYAIATSNGTTALHTALLAHGVGPGDEVITSPFTFIASVNSIIYTGATPVFVDILPCCFNINPDLIEAAITPRTKAIMAVHLFGYPCRMEPIVALARKHGLVVIEDAAQAIGAEYAGKRVGSFGTGCFSLYATKNVMSGEGGMITTNDAEVARKCRMLRAHGMERRYHHEVLGYNYRMTDLQAAIGLAQLMRLDEFVARRRANAAYFNAHIRNPGVVKPNAGCACSDCASARHVWHQYTVRVLNGGRDAAVEKLAQHGVGTGIFYPIPAHRQKHIVDMGYGDYRLPAAEQAAREVMSLPVHPSLSEEDLRTIVDAVNAL